MSRLGSRGTDYMGKIALSRFDVERLSGRAKLKGESRCLVSLTSVRRFGR